MATGIVKRHSRTCGYYLGQLCACGAGYEAWIYLGCGERARKSFRSELEAEMWRREALEALKQGTFQRPKPKPDSLAVALHGLLDAMRQGRVRPKNRERYKPSTIRGYEQHLRRRIGPAKIGSMRVDTIRRPHVQDFVDDLLVEGFASSTVNNVLNPIQVFYRRALDREELDRNPTERINVPKGNSKPKRVASHREIRELLWPLPPTDQPIWATALYTGLRRGELQALRCCDVDLMTRMINVRRGWDQYEGPITPKSEAGDREVPILELLLPFLERHLHRTGRGGEDLLFGRTAEVPFDPSTLAYRARNRWAVMGLEPITFHECRHTFASLLIAAPKNNKKLIQIIMGHTSIKTTFDIYGHILPGGLEEMREEMDALLGDSQVYRTSAAPADSSSPKDAESSFIQPNELIEKALQSQINRKRPGRGAGALLGLLQGGEICVSLYMWIRGRWVGP